MLRLHCAVSKTNVGGVARRAASWVNEQEEWTVTLEKQTAKHQGFVVCGGGRCGSK